MTDSHSAAPDVKRFSQLYPTPTVNPISNCTLNHEIHSQERKIIHSDAVQRCYGDNLSPASSPQPHSNLPSPRWLRSNKSKQVQLKRKVGPRSKRGGKNLKGKGEKVGILQKLGYVGKRERGERRHAVSASRCQTYGARWW